MRGKACVALGLGVLLGLPGLVVAVTASTPEHLALEARLNALEAAVTGDLTFVDSLAENQLVDRVSIVVSKSKIMVDGVDIGVNLVRNEAGQLAIPAAHHRGMLIDTLYDYLIEKWDSRGILRELSQREEKFQSEIMLSADGGVPHGVIAEVMYTAGQSRFSGFCFVVRNPWMDGLTTIPSRLPVIGHRRYFEYDEVPLRLSIMVSSTGLSVVSNATEGMTLPCQTQSCTGVDDYDWEGLNKFLISIHDSHRQSRTYVIVPERDISYDVVVRTMDVARWGPTVAMDASEEQWQQWQAQRREMFSRPIMAGGVE